MLYEGLPRQGPGNRACAARALALCAELGPAPPIIDQLAKEPEMHRRFGDHYAYEFFVARKPPAGCASMD